MVWCSDVHLGYVLRQKTVAYSNCTAVVRQRFNSVATVHTGNGEGCSDTAVLRAVSKQRGHICMSVCTADTLQRPNCTPIAPLLHPYFS
jgi:hypothetical protein